ncbi:DUF3080 domain-containing protein [Vibrio sp. Isolate24]|uniref:DUF3080 domain-containing protein n=1 Tax=Vibrio sp. Isolate24 TaxID=2908534 RepID=UPI001EFDB6AD|nr:DUF3080 domain-containing protein [Vibrio sp. Isolate24]MCG9678890.1 DUF3080 domain-containing protein [Vibrio sp. Isolate24]
MRFLFVFILTLSLTACDWLKDPIEVSLDTYLERIANIQNRDAPSMPANINILLPEKRELLITIPSISIGLLDSYELRKCGLFNLVAEKNSVLGKVQDQFRNFDYQIKLSYGIERCLMSTDISQALKAQLTPIKQQKLDQLPEHFANLAFTSEAMRHQLEATEWLSIEHGRSSTQIMQAINHIDWGHAASKALSDGDTLNALTPYQEALEKHPVLGPLSYSMLNASNKLNIVTQQLKNHDGTILCSRGRNTTKFRYLRNVFNQFYIGEIQPYLAKIDSMYNELNPMIDFVESGHPNYQYPIRQYHQTFRRATKEHVQYWQGLFKRCGAPPTR